MRPLLYLAVGLAIALTLAARAPTGALGPPPSSSEATAAFLSIAASDPEVGSSTPAASPSLGARLASWMDGVVRGAGGELVSAFGFTPEAAREILVPVTRERALSMDYRPRDLVGVPGGRSGVLVRAVTLPDLLDLLAASPGSGLAVVSGFRSFAAQATLFESRVRQRLAAAGGALSLDDARAQANRGTALPGHSQHQLGTAFDFSTPGLGYQVSRAFVQTVAASWLQEHAWEYGFVLPYTDLGQERTGYIAEPWHLRWVGRPLAAFLHGDRYLDSGDVVADDYLEALDGLLNQ